MEIRRDRDEALVRRVRAALDAARVHAELHLLVRHVMPRGRRGVSPRRRRRGRGRERRRTVVVVVVVVLRDRARHRSLFVRRREGQPAETTRFAPPPPPPPSAFSLAPAAILLLRLLGERALDEIAHVRRDADRGEPRAEDHDVALQLGVHCVRVSACV